MKAEIEFVYDLDGTLTERMRMVITPDSPSESTLLAMFARRLGREYNQGVWTFTIGEPDKPAGT